jgi:hypothetical protein
MVGPHRRPSSLIIPEHLFYVKKIPRLALDIRKFLYRGTVAPQAANYYLSSQLYNI